MQHRQIDMIIALKKEHNLSFEDVEAIEMHARRSREEACNRPDPKTEGDLQFSFQHNLALAMLYGDVTLEHITPEAVQDKKLKDARRKVKFIVDYPPEATGAAIQEPAHVVVKMKDGRIFSKERRFPIGHPQEPLTVAQFQDFFSKFTKGILTKKDMAKTSEIILNLETLKNVKELMNIIRIDG
jgi:2-methylcitrate dehydratase PrpD